MTDKPKTAPHPTAANDHPSPKKATRPPAPKAPSPAPRAPIPSAPVPVEAPQSKGKIAAMVGVTLAAGALIGRGIFGVAGRMLRRGR